MNPARYKIYSKLILLAIVIISVFSAYLCKDLKFDYDFESFFPRNDKDLDYYLEFRQKFEDDNEFVLIGLENKKGIFSHDFLKKVELFSDSLKRLKDVTRVISPTQVKYSLITPMGAFQLPYLHSGDPGLYKADSIRIYNSEELNGSLFSRDARSVAIFIKTTEKIKKAPSDVLLKKIEDLSASFHFDNVRIAGKMKATKVYLDKIRQEFIVFFALSFILIALFLYFSFRSFWGVWLPMVVVILSTLWTLGIMAAIGKPLDLMTVLLPTMLFVVGMSDVVHIITKFLEELRDGKEKFSAFKYTLKEVGFPTFLTLITTSIGFLTLFTSNIKPLRDFGLYTSLGIFIAYVLSFTILPSVMLFMKKPIKAEKENNQLFWNRNLHKLLLWVLRKKKLIWTCTIVLLVLSVTGISKIKVNNHLLEDLAKNDHLKEDFAFFEKEYSGARPFEMGISLASKNKSIFDEDVLIQMDKIEKFLRNNYGVGFIVSPLTYVKSMNKALNGGDPSFYKLPADSSELSEILQSVKKYRNLKELKLVLSSNETEARISGKMHDVGSLKIRELNKELDVFMKKNIRSDIQYKLTGAATVLDKNNEYLVNNMLQGLGLSVLMIALIIAFIHRSFKMVIISIIPNIVPMIMVGGMMGYFGVDLKISTSIIFSIAFGIATDDTIHFLARLKLELDKGKSVFYALKRTYISTGKAVVVTSLILSGGFLTLILSNFQSTFYFGLLVSIILFIAVITELLLLPPLLLWLYKKRDSSLRSE
jgi:uncharacterized protein